MHVRTFLRDLRGGRSLGDVAALTGVSKGHLSMYERGIAIPTIHEITLMRRVYGHPDNWYPPTVLKVMQPDVTCRSCGEPMPSERRGTRNCRACRG